MSPQKSSQVNNQMSSAHYFSSQINHIKNNAIEASVSILGFKNSALRQHVINELSQQGRDNPRTDHKSQKPNGLIGNSVFEVLFPWEEQGKTIADFSGDLLHPKTVNAVAKDIAVPYKHQAESWQNLNDKAQANSLVVTSGTGSGKTECFMVPILDDLVRLQQQDGGRLNGVHALFL
ncbi:MAG: DEAD/DEAH box helicase, partial [Psychrobacter pacificensis]|uniref:DEAD/DEAH box helicase n=1 Tax=Psychrobacter pacificensis TaxID=112002 RepID=UPI00239426CE